MKFNKKSAWGSLALACSMPTWARTLETCTIVDGVKKCEPIEMPTVIIVDPTWLVAGGVLLALVVVSLVFLALRIAKLSEKFEKNIR
jgi:hypothetical protein